ncbi:hypothetical protein D4764_21G0000020 [Takifugu flavidus]|uniref:DUF7041 domain-containing protein n=1 Tax=Takifugu flavidus TaxID=433684 RepID=A0A5C6NC89_9TELE|nr:hypothetical protein D4764_21G0000020 [Takifugu flavidus]
MFEAADDGISSSAMSPRHAQPASVIASVKLPDFWQSDPAPWFQHVEALFHLRGVTEDDSKYYLVVVALDQQSTRRAMQLLRDPPPHGKYAAIKELLLRRYSQSAAERADKLLSLPVLGGGPYGQHAVIAGLRRRRVPFPAHFPAPTSTSGPGGLGKLPEFGGW